MATQGKKEITIAVLPFKVLTDIEKLNPIMLGFTEDLITNFSRFAGLSVISHFSTRHIQDLSNQNDIKQLGADYIVTGSFRSQGEKIRFSIQLINTDDNNVVFAGHHIETPESIFLAEDAVTHQIVNVLQQQIDYDLLSYSYEKKSDNLEAYINWLKGMNTLRKGTAESNIEARVFFNKALKIDSNYSRAYTGISLSHFNEWSCQLWDRWDASSKDAQKYAIKALDLDENDYQALMVLGRTYLYSQDFEKAEHYFRKSIRMNPNDANNLMQIAFLMVYLGYADEALKLYNKANKLNPFHQDKYFTYGSFIYFELGEYQKTIDISKKVKIEDSWIDYPVFLAAAHYQLNNFEKAKVSWQMYLDMYRNHINKGKEPTDKEALDWHIYVNPYKGNTNLQPFWDSISKGDTGELKKVVGQPENQINASFVKKGDMWELTFQGVTALVKDSKGNHDIAKLLSKPNSEVHCMELMGSTLQVNVDTETIDGKAKTSYQKKIKSLLADIEDAKEMNNSELVFKLEEDYETLVDHLSKSLGLAGKPRKIGSSVEKARSAVTWRVRSAIKKIEAINPQLGKHLSNSISTGTFCSYKPELNVTWIV